MSKKDELVECGQCEKLFLKYAELGLILDVDEYYDCNGILDQSYVENCEFINSNNIHLNGQDVPVDAIRSIPLGKRIAIAIPALAADLRE